MAAAEHVDTLQGIKALLFAGSVMSLAAIPTNLTVFIGPKILMDPDGFSASTLVMSQSLFYAGWGLTALIVVPLSDRVGRKPVLYPLLAIGLAAIACAVMTSSPTLFVGSMLLSGSLTSANTVGYVLSQETSTGMVKQHGASILNVVYSAIMAAMAYICTRLTPNMDWRLEMVAWFFVGYAPCLLAGPFVAQEAPQFLPASVCDAEDAAEDQEKQRVEVAEATKGRDEEAIDGQSQSPMEMLFCKELRWTTLATCVCWASCCVGYFGLSFSAHGFSDDLGINMLMLALVDLISYGMSTSVAAAMGGARRFQMVSFLFSSIALFCMTLLPAGSNYVLAGAMVGRLLINFAFVGVYLLITEHFPTECCTSACGIANFAARTASMMAPMCGHLPMSRVSQLMGSILLLAAAATYSLPVPESERQLSKGAFFGRLKSGERGEKLLG